MNSVHNPPVPVLDRVWQSSFINIVCTFGRDSFGNNHEFVELTEVGLHHSMVSTVDGHFIHEPRAVTMKLWEPKRKVSKGRPTTPPNSYKLVWSQTFKCSVKSYVIGPSIKCYFDEFLFVQIFMHGQIEWINGCERLGVSWSPGFVLGLTTFERWVLKIFHSSTYVTFCKWKNFYCFMTFRVAHWDALDDSLAFQCARGRCFLMYWW